MFTVNRNPTRNELRTFAWAMPVGFAVLALLAWLVAWRKADGAALFAWSGSGWQIAAVVCLAMAVLFGTVSRSSPEAARRLYVIWMTATLPLGVVMSTILLTVIFVVVLPIFSLVVRFGDPLRRRLRPDGTYWEPHRATEPTLHRMQRPF